MADKSETAVAIVELARDYWVEAGIDRLKAGDLIELPVDEARRLIDAGVARRTDPLPGE